MIPYYPQPLIPVGRWLIPAFAVTTALAIAVGRWVLLRRARRLGIPREVIAPLYLCAGLAGIAGALAGPLLRSEGGLTSLGGEVGAAVAGLLYCRFRGYSYERTLCLFDVLTFGGTFAAAIGRIGCALAHEHQGILSNGWLAVRYPEGSRYDLGLIDFLFLVALCAAFCWLDRRPRPAGFFVFTGVIAYSAFRVLRVELEVETQVLGWVAILVASLCGVLLRQALLRRCGSEMLSAPDLSGSAR